MKAKLLFFSCEPGGAEVLIPVIRLLQSRQEFEIDVLGYGYALPRFSRKQVRCTEIAPVAEDGPTPLDNYRPDMLITSATSLPSVDMSEKRLWRQAKRRGIPSLAFLDQWQNYTMRFSGPRNDERMAYLPDWINCLNDIGRREMIGEGFDEARLVALGHPYLSSLADDLPALDVFALKNKLRIPPERKVALFVSEPVREYSGDRYGYDQYQVLDYFLSKITESADRPAILVKLHPKEDRELFRALESRFKTLSLQFVSEELSPLECLAVSDFVFGMMSVMLIEAYVLGKHVVSLQPGLRVQDPMVLSRHGLIPAVFGREARDLFALGRPPRSCFDFEFPADAFLRFIDESLK